LGSMSEVDIAGIESRHAAVRRLLVSKSVQSWTASLQDISADFLCRSSHVGRTEFQDSKLGFFNKKPRSKRANAKGKSARKKRKLQSKVKAKTKRGRDKQIGGGGAQRAFFHVKIQCLPKEVWQNRKALFSRLNAEFAALSAYDRLYYDQLGSAGALSHSRGHRSFAKRFNSSARRADVSVMVARNPANLIEQQIKKARVETAVVLQQQRDQETESADCLQKFYASESAPTLNSLLFESTGDHVASSFVPRAQQVPTLHWTVPADLITRDNGFVTTKDLHTMHKQHADMCSITSCTLCYITCFYVANIQ
jgi:hypothetical protein